MLGRKIGDAREFEGFLVREGVPDADGPMVVHADDVSGPGLFHAGPVLSHEDGGVGDLNLLAKAVMADLHPPGELA